MASSQLDEALGKLFSVPVEEFMSARDALVNELRAAGDKEAAATVKAQHKPTLAAHALNQLARNARSELETLMETSRELASGKDFKAALERQRGAFEAVRAKMPGSDLTDLSTVVRGAMVDADLAERLMLGRFSKVPEVQVGFFGAAPEGSAASRPAKHAEKSHERTAKEKVAPKVTAAPAVDHARLAREKEEREAQERLARQIAKAEADVARLTTAADIAERKAIDARRLADEAMARLKSLK